MDFNVNELLADKENVRPIPNKNQAAQNQLVIGNFFGKPKTSSSTQQSLPMTSSNPIVVPQMIRQQFIPKLVAANVSKDQLERDILENEIFGEKPISNSATNITVEKIFTLVDQMAINTIDGLASTAVNNQGNLTVAHVQSSVENEESETEQVEHDNGNESEIELSALDEDQMLALTEYISTETKSGHEMTRVSTTLSMVGLHNAMSL
jgi:hypothetical protein